MNFVLKTEILILLVFQFEQCPISSTGGGVYIRRGTGCAQSPSWRLVNRILEKVSVRKKVSAVESFQGEEDNDNNEYRACKYLLNMMDCKSEGRKMEEKITRTKIYCAYIYTQCMYDNNRDE